MSAKNKTTEVHYRCPECAGTGVVRTTTSTGVVLVQCATCGGTIHVPSPRGPIPISFTGNPRQVAEALLHAAAGIGTDEQRDLPPSEPPLLFNPIVLRELASRYPDYRSARLLWQRAGGHVSEIEHHSDPIDLWQAAWGRASAGASVSRAALLRAALRDLPNNTDLNDELRRIANPATVRMAEDLVAGLLEAAAKNDVEKGGRLLSTWTSTDEDASFAAISPALEARVPDQQPGGLLHGFIQRVHSEFQSGVLAGTVKAATSVAIKMLLEALAGR